MKRLILWAAVGVAMTAHSAGVAGAQGSPRVTGMTFSDASATLQKVGFTAKVGTIVGSQLAQSDCLVTSQVDSPASTSYGTYGPSQFKTPPNYNKPVVLSLNCNAALASATDPGNSVASPAGQQEKKDEKTIAWEQTPDGQKWCEDNKKHHPDWGWSTGTLKACPG